MTETIAPADGFLLPEDVLERFRERAARYDQDNTFFAEDLEELRDLGYLRAAIPTSHGGLGLSLHQINQEQRRLATFAPATALGINMHLYWTGPVADRIRAGHDDVDWLAKEIAAGAVLAAGHGERGNDVSIDDSTSTATPLPGGGYRISGHKIFTSLSPAWDWLGVHARDDSDPAHPKIVHTFVHRDDAGVRTIETWDTLGVRATASHDTELTNVEVSASRTVGVVDLGAAPAGYVAGIFPWVLPLLGNIYYGIGRRAIDTAIASAQSRSALSTGLPIAAKPFVQYHVAEAELALEGVRGQLDELTTALTAGADLGERTLLKLFAAKENGTRVGRTATELALEIAGAGSLSRRGELERLFRDARAGGFHPPNSDAVRGYIGAFALGQL